MNTADFIRSEDIANNTNHAMEEFWYLIQNDLRREYGEESFKSWIGKLEFVECNNHAVTFNAPTRFIKDWIVSHFEVKLLKLWRKYVPTVKKISILVPKLKKTVAVQDNKFSESSEKVGYLVGNTLDPRLTFSNFVVGSSNQFAYAAAKAVSEAKIVNSGSNPLFLYGGVGLGKTHLMHAIALDILKNNQSRKVVYISAEKFMYEFIHALRNNSIMQFKEKYRTVDILMVDDIQFICGKNSTQEEFFHILNALIADNKQIVISGDRSPSDLENMEDRIKSRLGWGLVADIHNTTYELRLGILESKVELIDVKIPQKVLEFLASKITSNVRELEGALNKIIAHANLTKQEVTLETTQQILHDLLRSNEKIITVEEIQKKVAERYNLKVSDMYSSRRTRLVARPRQVAMYLSKSLTTRSLVDIGRKFGGKDHTTVMHAIKTIEVLMNNQNEVSEDIRLLTKTLQC